MKTVAAIVTLAFLVIAAVMISLVRRGGALKPAGVIKPAEIGNNPALIPEQIATRLYPDFHEAKFVVWRVEAGDAQLSAIPSAVFAHLRIPPLPTLHDLRHGGEDGCAENCWYVQDLEKELPDAVIQKMKDKPTVVIHVQKFQRDQKVPEVCETEKILTVECMKPVATREVRRKIKTAAPHYFMQRYQSSQFFLYLESP